MTDPQVKEEGAGEFDPLLAKAEALNQKYAANDPAQPGEEVPLEPAQPEVKPQIPYAAFEATADLVVVGIKKGLGRFEGGEAAAEIWDDPMFRTTLIPVLQKYNLSVMSLPPEVALIGAIVILAMKSADAIKEAKNAKEKTNPAE